MKPALFDRDATLLPIDSDPVFRSDTTNDLPPRERVSHPVASRPGTDLELPARRRRWPILRRFP